MQFHLGFRRATKWPFLVANDTSLIIREDFVIQNELIMDLKNKRFGNPAASVTTNGELFSATIVEIFTVNT